MNNPTIQFKFNKLAYGSSLLNFFDTKPKVEPPSISKEEIAIPLAAGALPFAGMIGQEKMIHKDKGKLVQTKKELLKLLKPGDIIVSGNTDMSTAKGLISLATGTPKGYHVSTYIGRDGTLEIGPAMGMQHHTVNTEANLQVLRPIDNNHRKTLLRNIKKRVFDEAIPMQNGIEKNLRKGLKDYGLSRKEIKKTTEGFGSGALYDGNSGTIAGLKELFIPKIRNIEPKTDALLQQRMQAGADFQKNIKRHVKEISDTIVGEMEKGLTVKKVKEIIPKGVGYVCSTLPSILGETQIVKGKSIVDVIPSDYLRSRAFEPIARMSNGIEKGLGSKILNKVLSYGPTASRSIVGIGLGASALALTKLLKKKES